MCIRTPPLLLSSLVILLVFNFLLLDGKSYASILPAPEKISAHTYAWIGPYEGPSKENAGFRMNMGFIIGGNSIAVIDSGYTEAMAKEMLLHIRKISNLPIKYVINTNSQPHRFFGNTVFKNSGSIIVATKEETLRMKKRAGGFASSIERMLELKPGSISNPALPTYLISKKTNFDLGAGVNISVLPAGAGHTPNSLMVIIPGDNIIFAGDILYSGRLLAILPESNVKNWILVYENLKKYELFTFVPGHGQAAKLNSFQFSTYQYLSTLYKHMSAAVENDVSIDDAMASLDQTAFSKLENFENLAGRNASWAYIQAEQLAFE